MTATPHPLYVYAIENVATGAVKIGVSLEPVSRARTLHYAMGVPTRLLAASVGAGEWHGRRLERGLHAMLKADRIRGEWFRPSPLVERLLATFNGTLNTDDLDPHDVQALTAVYEGRRLITAPAALAKAPAAPDTFWQGWEGF